MRTLVQNLLAEVDPITFPADKIVQGSALDSALINVPAFPFMVHRLSITRRTVSRRGQPSLDVWVYDEPGSYLRIDKTLRMVRAKLLAVQDMWLPDRSEHLAAIDWVNDSSDLPAEEFGGITRMATFTLTGSTA